MVNELISVIIPVYNTEKYLNKCLESIISQSYNELEIILIDDGSTDSSPKICDSYAEKDSRVKVFHNENCGVSLSRRFGLERSQSSLVAFIDSDDYISPRMLETLYKSLKRVHSDVSVCQYECIFENGSLCPSQPKPFSGAVLSGTDTINLLGTDEGHQLVPLCNKLYRKEIFSDISFPGPMFCEDELLIHRILYNCGKVSLVPEILYHYLRRENSRTSCIDDSYILDAAFAFLDRCLFLREKGLYKPALLALSGAVNLIYASDTKKENKVRERELSKALKKEAINFRAPGPGLRTRLKLFLLPKGKFIYKGLRKFKASVCSISNKKI